MAEIALNQVLVGIGNVVYDQHHRENRVTLDNSLVNQAVNERFNGGITAATINMLGLTGGGLANQAAGVINVEGGWNQRRGLCMLRMTVTDNALKQDQMAVMGYLVGGSNTIAGIIPNDVLFVPVRSWTVTTETTSGMDFLPTTKQGVTESSQFLMADPQMLNELQTIRPVDVINYGFGDLNAAEDGMSFDGTTNSDLNRNGLVVSKSGNLNPLTNAQQIMNHAARVSRNQVTHNSLSENMASSMGEMRETEIYEHPFLAMMMSALGMPSYAGFVGFSFEELRQVFQGFDSVVTPPSDRNTEGHNHTLDTSSLGAVDPYEIIAHELAFICLHAMLDIGLLFAQFVSSNGVSGMGVNNGSIYWESGASSGVMANDQHLHTRMEQLKDYIQSSFYQKYAAHKLGLATVVGADVTMNVFGECVIEITLNGNDRVVKRVAIPSYCVNRTSSNIAAGHMQKELANTYVETLQNYFVQG